MFEAAELGQTVEKDEFKARAEALVTELLEAQRLLRAAKVPVVVVVSGVEGAGKSDVVNRLMEWLDARGLQTHAMWDETDEERERPPFWRFWRRLPPRGTIGVFYGSWYTRPVVDRVYGGLGEAAYEQALARIAQFERMLAADGTVFVKLWFHLSKKAQRDRLDHPEKRRKGNWKVSPLTRKFAKKYDKFLAVSERAVRLTDFGASPWTIIDSECDRYRDLAAGEALLAAIRRGLQVFETGRKAMLEADSAAVSAPAVTTAPTRARKKTSAKGKPGAPAGPKNVLDGVDLTQRLDDDEYDDRLEKAQRCLFKLAWQARKAKRSSVILFEGWDAAGKGSAIRRVVTSLDARLFRVIPIAAPTDEERAQHYLWRFWRHLPMAGNVTLFDRTWYGRVLVERVEGFARPFEWARAYQEINEFEAQLVEAGAVVTKFWLHVSPDEQLRRFKERQATARKAHKITDEDWRNREKWDAYVSAIHDMVVRTSTSIAPWTLVAGDDKRFARVQIIETLCARLEQALDG